MWNTGEGAGLQTSHTRNSACLNMSVPLRDPEEPYLSQLLQPLMLPSGIQEGGR
jgi:hypothetical protein